jgi:methylmalonyl-CoA mutase N-terminal domain/subunit
MGGAVTAIESGYVQREIQEASWAYQRAVDEGKKTIVGVNKYRLEEEEPQIIFRVNPETERAQLKRLRAARKQRDDAAARAALKRLNEVCRDGENLMYPIVEAVRAYATLGEICGVMREAFGDYRAPTAV